MFRQYMQQAATEYGLSLTEGQQQAFERYFELLIEWNEKMNLTAITDPQEVAVKHMIDSLSCYDAAVFPRNTAVIDVGAGAGFPGLPLKIFRPDLTLTLLDSLQKRVYFLQAAVEQLQLREVFPIHGRAEEFGVRTEWRETYQIAVSRAVARLSVLCELCLPFVAVGGYFVALKGAQFQQELAEAQPAVTVLGAQVAAVREIKLPGLADRRAVIYIKKIRQTPAKYPRRPGVPEKKPL